KTKSMTRYLPPNGSALTARSAQSTPSRSPLPPERIRASTSRITPLQWVARREPDRGKTDGRERARSGQERWGRGGGPAGPGRYQLKDADRRCVVSRLWSSGNAGSSEAKKRWSAAA